MQIKYEDGLCIYIEDGKAFTLYSSGMLEVSDFDENGTFQVVEMQLPEWLTEGISKTFMGKIAKR